MSLDQLKILVTGGASGIGKATVERLAAGGAAVAIGDRDAAGAEALATGLADAAGPVSAFPLDVADAASVERCVEAATDALGGLTGLVNVAGVQISAPIAEQTEEDWDRQMAVNAKGPWLMTRASLPALREAAPLGSIVHVASMAAIKGFAGVPGYSASKGAVAALTRSAAVELAPDVRVNCVCPGWVDTPFNDPIIATMGGREAQEEFIRATVPLKRQASPAEIAPTIIHLLSPDSSYTTGQLFTPDGGSCA